MNLSYAVGEVVLMEWQGWLKAFRVVAVYDRGDSFEYKMEMVEQSDSNPGWTRPAS